LVSQNLIDYPVVTLADVRNSYQSKIKVENDHLRAPFGSVYPIRTSDRPKRVVDHEPRPNRDRYQPYSGDRRGNGYWRNPTRNEKRKDRGRGLMSKNDFDRPLEGPRLSEYNFNVDATSIISTIAD